jgi:tetratricopeptide (TPR) repeat protein
VDEAASTYEQAIASAPEDFRLYVELASLYEKSGALDRRVRLLDRAPESVKRHSPVALALAGAYVDAGRFAEAAKVFETHQFTSGEGDNAMLNNFRRAHIGLARQASASGDHVRAAAEYVAATGYPKTLGIGRPAYESLAREYVSAAHELEAAGRRDEADALWRRAATEPLNSPTEPGEPWSEHYYFKALALEHVGNRDEARALYERLARLADDGKMLEAEPSLPIGAIRWALAGAGLRALGRTDEARAALARALELDPASELARAQMAEIDGRGRPAGE